MIIIFAIFLTTVCANSDEKFINHLPDEKQQEFLDNVARRIMKYVKSNGTHKESIKLTDAQLNEHNFYVQPVIKQETAAFEARRNKRDDKSIEEDNKSKEKDDSEKDLEVKPIQFRDDADTLDLALTSMNRRIDDGIPQDNLTNTFETDNVTEDTLPLQMKSVTGNVNSEEAILINSNEEKGKINHPGVSTLYRQIQKSDAVQSTLRTQDLKIKTTNTSLTIASVNNVQYETTAEISVPLSLTVTTSIVNNVSTETTTGSKIQILEHDSATNSKAVYLITEGNDYLVSNFVPSSNATKSYTQYVNDSTLTSSDESTAHSVKDTTTNKNKIQGSKFESEVHTLPENYSTVIYSESSAQATEFYIQNSSGSALTDESTTDLVIDTTASKSKDVSATVHSQVFTTVTQNTAEVKKVPTENYSGVTEDSSPKKLLETITKITTFIPILTTPNIKEEQSTKKLKKKKFSKAIKQSENDTLVSYIANRAFKKIKHELDIKKQGTFIYNDVKTTYKGDTHLNHYRVYEISWPAKRNNQPFLRSQEPIKDQPYFVSVHKYSPNFAYYNPKNRLGTNKVDENSILLKTHQLREENIDIHDKEPSDVILQFNNGLRKFVHLRKGPTTTAPSSEKRDSQNSESSENSENSENSDNSNSYDVSSENVDKHIKRNKDKKNKRKSATKAESVSSTDDNDDSISIGKIIKSLDNPTKRSNAESKVSIYMNVLKDLMLDDNNALKQYDWLTTTLKIQTALLKILKLIKGIKQSEPVHPTDLQILRYMAFLYNFSLEIKEDNKLGNRLRKRLKLFPRNKKKRKNKLFKVKGLTNRVRPYLRTVQPGDGLSHLYDFLIDVQDGLFNLHEAIRQIAMVTTFNRQNWYGNLKQVYLSADEKHLRELLLHISMSRLIDLVEHSCKHLLDNDFIQFVKTNKRNAKRIVEEIIFVNDIVHEITINKE